MIPIITFFNKYGGYILLITTILFATLFFNECDRRQQAIEIAENNTKALKDTSIKLKVTKAQLKIYDEQLSKAYKTIDSLKGIEPTTIIRTKIIYRDKPDTVKNTIEIDSTGVYKLKFTSDDSVRTIEGVSEFQVGVIDSTINIKPGITIINKFKLNFGLLISEYRDEEAKVDKIDITPFYLLEDGTFSNIPVPKDKLEIPFRGAQILERPYQLPNNSPSNKINSGWALSVSPISTGLFLTPNGVTWGVGPSVGLTYYFTK